MKALKSIFLFGSIGVASPDRFHELLSGKNEGEWNDFRKAVMDRVNNINVIASLFITGAAVFISTVSPDKDIADWANRVSFYTFGGTIGVAMLAIFIGCIISYVFMDLRTVNLRPKFHGDSSREVEIAVILFLLWTHTLLLLTDLVLVIIAFYAAVLNGTSVLMRIALSFFTFASVFYLGITIFLIFKLRR
ncbi:hypothetical protein FRB94_009834 [Tulasnella sp. JGI-2019a]|nr:hypothetical protein FRB94_009834 [Tulasnella sp. JGI-2019a]KAG9003123.1 hypothetical protein FRB93_011201 [Tulasnella sp. JGI-2019a]